MPHRQRSNRVVAILLAGCLAAASTAVIVTAQAAPGGDATMHDFARSGDYVLVLAGKEVAAEIYISQRVGGMLIISSSLPSPVLLMPSTNTAQLVNLMKIDKKADGTVDLLPGAGMASLGAIEFADDIVHFKVNGKTADLRPNPPLLGLRRADEVTAHNPEYAPRVAAYTPSAAAVATLKRESRPVRVRIFFGSWCPHCREMVPHAIKLEQALKGGNIHFEYYGLPPHFGAEPIAKENVINGVPTGIIYIGGKEAGRIVGLSWNSPETTLVTVLSATKG